MKSLGKTYIPLREDRISPLRRSRAELVAEDTDAMKLNQSEP